VNNNRSARIITRRLNGGPGFVVPHGVGEPHGFDVVSVSFVSSGITPARSRASSAIVGISSGGMSADCAATAASCSSRRASPSLNAVCALGPFTVHVENA